MKTFTQEELVDIRMVYRQAKSPGAAIGILADMYLCGKDDIRRALEMPVVKRYTAEFKTQVVHRIRGGMSLHAAQKEYNVSYPTLCRWAREWDTSRKVTLEEAIRRLKREYETGLGLEEVQEPVAWALERVLRSVNDG